MRPNKRDELTYLPTVHLAQLFVTLIDKEVTKEEFEDHLLMEEDIEIGVEEGGVHKYVDRNWGEILKVKTTMGQMRFPAFTQVMVVVFNL